MSNQLFIHYTHTTQGEKNEKKYTERGRETESEKGRLRQTDRQTERKMDRQTCGQTDRHTDRRASGIRQMDIIRKRYIKIILQAFCVRVSATDVSLLASTCQLFSLLGPACTGV